MPYHASPCPTVPRNGLGKARRGLAGLGQGSAEYKGPGLASPAMLMYHLLLSSGLHFNFWLNLGYKLILT